MSEVTENIWWLVLSGSVLIIFLIGLVIVSVLISNKKLLRLQQQRFIELRKSEQMYADLFNNVSDLVYIHQFDGIIIKINQAVEKLLGYKVEEVIGKPFQKVFKISNEEFYDYIHSIRYNSTSIGIIKLHSKDGQELVFEYQNSISSELETIRAIRGIARNVTEKIKAEEQLKQKDKLLTTIADASIVLLVNPNHDSAINQVLEMLGKVTNVDRVYIFENHYDSETNELLMSQRFEWCKEGIEPQIDNPLLQNLPYKHPYVESLFNKVIKGGIYSGIVRFMSDSEREILELQDIKSILIIPIYIGKNFWGFIGFDDCTNEREWTEIEKAVLKTAAGSIGGLIGLMKYEEKLTETNLFLSSILESSITISIITTELSGIIKYWNSGAEKLFGYKTSEVYNKNIADVLIDSADKITRERYYDIVKSAIETKHAHTSEVVFRNKKGNQIWINLTISPMIDDSGKVVGISSIGEDITQRKITELALIQNEEMFRSVWENSADGMRLIDENARIKLVNKAFCNLVQMPYEKLIGQEYFICYFDQDINELNKFTNNISAYKIPTRESTIITLWNGKQVPVEISNSFIELQDNKRMLLSIFRDVSEQKEYERRIKLSEEKYRKLALHLQSIREDERTKIARDIHDDLGQQLTALYFEISAIRTKKIISEKDVESVFDMVFDAIDKLISSVQKISSELRPAILDDLGLIPAIEWEVSRFEHRTKIKSKLNSSVDNLNLSSQASTIIFRILQESLTNVARHSKAKNVVVDLSIRNGDFIMVIGDDGIGIDKEKLDDPKSIGLIGMKERAMNLRGELIIESEPRKGTKIILKIPTNGGSE